MAHTGAMATVPQSCNLLNPVVFCANEVTLLFLTIILSIINLQCCASFSCTERSSGVCVCRYRYIFFQILFHYRLLQIIEYSSLGYKIHPCCLSVLCECSVTSVQSALCDPMNCNPPASPVHEILQARILEQVAISFSRGPSRLRD